MFEYETFRQVFVSIQFFLVEGLIEIFKIPTRVFISTQVSMCSDFSRCLFPKTKLISLKHGWRTLWAHKFQKRLLHCAFLIIFPNSAGKKDRTIKSVIKFHWINGFSNKSTGVKKCAEIPTWLIYQAEIQKNLALPKLLIFRNKPLQNNTKFWRLRFPFHDNFIWNCSDL